MKPAPTQRHPSRPPTAWQRSGGATPEGELPPFDWAALVPLVVHPVQVAIIESLTRIGHPLSATELCEVFDEPGTYYLSLVSYHLAKLRGLEVIQETGRRPVRGATETFYFFPPPDREPTR